MVEMTRGTVVDKEVYKADERSVEKGSFRHNIAKLEHELANIPGVFVGDTDNCPLTHSFADNIYVREIFIPKGMVLVGKIHKHSHPNFLMSGEVVVATEHHGLERIKAPKAMISEAGTKRAVIALEDTVWITVHATDETDLEKIEDYVIAKDYEAYESFKRERIER